MSEVYFAHVQTSNSLLYDLERLFDKAFPDIIKKGDLTAIKMHFGELGNTAFIKSIYVKTVVGKVKSIGANPFLTDSNTLYRHKRHNAVDHLQTAVHNGFTYATVGAPIIIADGLHGHSHKQIEINKKYFKTVKIGEAIAEADSIIALSHFKGHMSAGFGGCIKNLSMGCASRAGKQQQHSSTKPKINTTKCIKCRKCGEICPEEAIDYARGYAEIDYKKCVGCDECVTVCPTEAIAIRWDTSGKKEMQEKMVEYAYGAVKDKRAGFINFLLDITPDCDCFPKSDAPIVPNIGILASLDPVAIDQASLDLVNQQTGLVGSRLKHTGSKNKFKDIHGFTNTYQLEYAEQINLGSRKYKLIKI